MINEYSVASSSIEVDLKKVDRQYKQFVKIRTKYESDIKNGKVPKKWYRCNFCGKFKNAKNISEHLLKYHYLPDIFNLLNSENKYITEFKGFKIDTPLLGQLFQKQTRYSFQSNHKGLFQKGQIPWNIGKHPNRRTRKKISKSGMGRPAYVTEESKRKLSESRIGIIFSNTHCHNISKWHKGRKLSRKHRRAIAIGNTGKTMSEAAKRAIGKANKGNKPWSFNHHLPKRTRKRISRSVKKNHWSKSDFANDISIEISKNNRRRKFFNKINH